MPRKSSDKTYGEKLISLFARLLFTRERHSLSDLARMLDCSKQTVLRLIEDIERSYPGEKIQNLLHQAENLASHLA